MVIYCKCINYNFLFYENIAFLLFGLTDEINDEILDIFCTVRQSFCFTIVLYLLSISVLDNKALYLVDRAQYANQMYDLVAPSMNEKKK